MTEVSYTAKFEDLQQQLTIKARPDFNFTTDPNVEKGVVSIDQSHLPVVHPDDKEQLMDIVTSSGWNPIDQT